MERDKRTIATKAGIMAEHFFSKVYNTKKLKGKAKGMVVTQDIESASPLLFEPSERILEDQRKSI